jgi:MSHA biogenesis protein MshP
MSLIVALFLIVIVALLAAFAVSIGTSRREQTNLLLASDRAAQAAHAGIEFGATRALRSSSCVNTTLNLTQGALSGFTVTVTCTQYAHAVGGPSFLITSVAEHGRFGAAGYVSKSMAAHF